MDVGSIVSIGSQGIQRSQQNLQQTAEEIAGLTLPQSGETGATEGASDTQLGNASQTVVPSRELAEAAVELRQEQQVFDANARVVETGQETVGRLLDINA